MGLSVSADDVPSDMAIDDIPKCQYFILPRICRLLYVRLASLASLHYNIQVGPDHISLVSGDALASTACTVPV